MAKLPSSIQLTAFSFPQLRVGHRGGSCKGGDGWESKGKEGWAGRGGARRGPGRGLCHCRAGIWQCDFWEWPVSRCWPFSQGVLGGSLSDSPLVGTEGFRNGWRPTWLMADGWVSVFSGVFIGSCCWGQLIQSRTWGWGAFRAWGPTWATGNSQSCCPAQTCFPAQDHSRFHSVFSL